MSKTKPANVLDRDAQRRTSLAARDYRTVEAIGAYLGSVFEPKASTAAARAYVAERRLIRQGEKLLSQLSEG